jgi:hypothetical protein
MKNDIFFWFICNFWTLLHLNLKIFIHKYFDNLLLSEYSRTPLVLAGGSKYFDNLLLSEYSRTPLVLAGGSKYFDNLLLSEYSRTPLVLAGGSKYLPVANIHNNSLL